MSCPSSRARPFAPGSAARSSFPSTTRCGSRRKSRRALEFAHKRGIVHRDIKPENILLQDGQALVADFGIALAVQQAGGSRMTQTGMSLGTPAYMSPEQAMGERDIGARSDVYALGAMTYEMLTGEPPFTGPNSQAIVAQVLTETPRPLRPKRPNVSPAVEGAVLTALEKLPADRFGSAKDYADALDGKGELRCDARHPGVAPFAPFAPYAPRHARRRRTDRSPPRVAAGWFSHGSARATAPLPSRYQLNLPGLQRSNLRYSGSSIALSRRRPPDRLHPRQHPWRAHRVGAGTALR